MNQPTIQEIRASAWHKIGLHGKGAHHYKLLIWQEEVSMLNTVQQPVAMWHIEYQGKSFYQPFITVSGVSPEAVLKRFDEELVQFVPASLADIEALIKRVA